jgi:hypothetical protein
MKKQPEEDLQDSTFADKLQINNLLVGLSSDLIADTVVILTFVTPCSSSMPAKIHQRAGGRPTGFNVRLQIAEQLTFSSAFPPT